MKTDIIRNILLTVLLAAAVFCLAACGHKAEGMMESVIPPLPTYSDETPAPTEQPIVPSSAPVAQTPEVSSTPEPSPVPTPTPNPDMPHISISGETYPQDMLAGNIVDLRGSISCDKGSISYVNAMITDAAGNVIQHCEYAPYSVTLSLAGTVNAAFHFATLAPGDYVYVLIAHGENNGITAETVLINHEFSVYSTSAEMSQAAIASDINYTAKLSKGTENEDRIWNFFITYLDNPYGAAGVLANIELESGCNPQRVQDDLAEDAAFSASYTQQVDEGNISRSAFISSVPAEGYGIGYGLCQWSYDRKAGLYDLAKEQGKSVGDLDTQLTYILTEMMIKYPDLIEYLKTTTDARQAAREFCYIYEQAAVVGDRAGLAEDYLEKYAS